MINHGHLIMLLALVSSSLSLLLYIASYRKNDAQFERTARVAVYVTLFLVSLASVILMTYFVNNDYRFAYVFNNASKDLPVIYRIAGFWAGNEGSFLLWLFIYSIMIIPVMNRNDEFRRTVVPILVAIQLYLIFLLIINSPFKFIWDAFPKELKPGQAPGDGSGINPLLMDPWMIAHPPVLFLGYASAAIPFAYAVSAIIRGSADRWASLSRSWIVFSMVSLGIGIFMGAYWAYKVLGWGGYWGWDPVENSSLIPWLVAVALVHGLLLQEKKRMFHRANIILALVYFSLVFYSTFLTRSGILSNFSVHSFGESSLTKYLAVFIAASFLIPLFLFITKPPATDSANDRASITSWHQLLILGVITLLVYAAVIFTGTSMPIITSLFSAQGTPVTTAFYNNMSIPFGIILLILMAAGTMAMGVLKKEILTLRTGIFALVALAGGVLMNIFIAPLPVPIIFTALSLFLLLENIYELFRGSGRANRAARIAHAGIAVMVIGIITSNFHSTTTQKWCTLNDEQIIGSISLTFKGMTDEARANVKFDLKKDGETREIKTAYYIDPKSQTLYREPSIISSLLGDLYITPEQYRSGEEGFTTAVLAQNQTMLIGGLSVQFEGFVTSDMQTGSPKILAKIRIGSDLYQPGVTISGQKREQIDARLKGSGRLISLKEIDPQGKRILLYIEPEKGKKVPADMIIVDVSHKRLIWIVWLGTLLISAGGIMVLARNRKKKAPVS